VRRLALRGRAVLGAALVVVPLVVLSGWRMAAATFIGANLWPVGLAAMIVTLGMACAAACVAGILLRHRSVWSMAAENPPAG
jgi:hypothetical protein